MDCIRACKQSWSTSNANRLFDNDLLSFCYIFGFVRKNDGLCCCLLSLTDDAFLHNTFSFRSTIEMTDRSAAAAVWCTCRRQIVIFLSAWFLFLIGSVFGWIDVSTSGVSTLNHAKSCVRFDCAIGGIYRMGSRYILCCVDRPTPFRDRPRPTIDVNSF